MPKFAKSMSAAVLAACLAVPAGAEEKNMDRTVTISATGNVTAAPDSATIQTGVSSEAKTAREAMSRNAAAMTKVIAELKSVGVDAKDIQTTQFSIEPIHAYPKEGAPPVITGHRVHNMVAVKVRDLGALGGILDQLVTVGANQMHGIAFEVSKADVLKDEARKEAMANALRRAKLYAQAAGAEIGEVVQISEDVSFVGPRPGVFHQARAAMAAESVPIERGEQALEARVTATWKLK